MGSQFAIRPFASIDEFKECVRFQEETPRSIQEVRDASFEAALRWRTVTRSVLSTYLQRGFEAREFYGRNRWGEYLLVSQDRLT